MKTTNQITFRTRAQASLFQNEIKGQISDGMWENTNGTDWETWCGTEVLVGSNTGRKGYVRKTGFAIERLIPIIGDRMMTYAKLAIAFPEKTNDELYQLENFSQPIQRWANDGKNSFWTDVCTMFRQFAKDAGMAEPSSADGQRIVKEKIAAVNYTEKDLRADVKEMKATMKKTWKPVETTLADAREERRTEKRDVALRAQLKAEDVQDQDWVLRQLQLAYEAGRDSSRRRF